MKSKVKCLLVDDLEENLLALGALLKQDNIEILPARSAPQALELLLEHDDIALALLDVQMPDMDGFELAELMRGSERTRNIPIIFVTAGARDQLRLFKGYDSGAVDFLYKPIEPYILKNKADVFFQLYRHKQRLARELAERSETLRFNEMFMAVLGHDLRNPLNAILTSAYMLERTAPDDAMRRTAARITSSGKRMTRMIEDLLDLARARLAGGISLRREPSDLSAIVHRVVQEHRVSHAQRRIDVHAQGDVRGDWDADRLGQVVSNLIGNALDHGDQQQSVEVSVDGTGHEVAFAVTNGGTIPPDVLPYVFDPFRGGVRVNGARNDGLGLGLYIVEQIVLAHEGRVRVESVDDTHTRFEVRIPRRANSLAA